MLLEFVILLTSLIILWTVWLNWRHPQYPKGPISIPIFGNLLHIPLFAKDGSPTQLFMEHYKKYGKISAFDFASFPAVLIHDYKLVKEAWNNPLLCGRPQLHAARERTGGVARGLMFQHGDEWTEQRRFTLRHLRDFGFGKTAMETLVMDEVHELLEGFRKDAGKPIVTQNRFNVAVLNALWTITAGTRFRHDDPLLLKIVAIITDNVAQGTGQMKFFMPWLVKYFPKLSGWDEYKKNLPAVYNFLHEFTKERLKTYDGGAPQHFTDVYIDEIRKTTDPNSSFYGTRGELTLTATLQDLFFAGAETTSTTLTWACLLLAVHPEKQEKVRDEILTVLGSKTPALADRIKMPYLEAIIFETLRFSALVPNGLFHKALESVFIGGYYIPKGTLLIANLHAVHHDKKFWHDPEIFRPERFLSPDATAVVKHDALIPFSFGKRICPGESLAKDELFLFLAGIIQEFIISWDPESPKPSLERQSGLIATPKPHKLVFKSYK